MGSTRPAGSSSTVKATPRRATTTLRAERTPPRRRGAPVRHHASRDQVRVRRCTVADEHASSRSAASSPTTRRSSGRTWCRPTGRTIPTATSITCAARCSTRARRSRGGRTCSASRARSTKTSRAPSSLAARDRGLGLRIHANQLGPGPGARLAAELGAASADHVTYLTEDDIWALSDAGVVATLLPVADLSTREPWPDARGLIEAGATVALATDCNPGTSFTTNMPIVVALAVTAMRMTPAEALWSATAGGARALQRDDVGDAQGRRARRPRAARCPQPRASVVSPRGSARRHRDPRRRRRVRSHLNRTLGVGRYPGHVRSEGSRACGHRLPGRGRAGVLRVDHAREHHGSDRPSPRPASRSQRAGRRPVRGRRGRPGSGGRGGRASGAGRSGPHPAHGAPDRARAARRRHPGRARDRAERAERRRGRGVHLLAGNRAGRRHPRRPARGAIPRAAPGSHRLRGGRRARPRGRDPTGRRPPRPARRPGGDAGCARRGRRGRPGPPRGLAGGAAGRARPGAGGLGRARGRSRQRRGAPRPPPRSPRARRRRGGGAGVPGLGRTCPTASGRTRSSR